MPNFSQSTHLSPTPWDHSYAFCAVISAWLLGLDNAKTTGRSVPFTKASIIGFVKPQVSASSKRQLSRESSYQEIQVCTLWFTSRCLSFLCQFCRTSLKAANLRKQKKNHQPAQGTVRSDANSTHHTRGLHHVPPMSLGPWQTKNAIALWLIFFRWPWEYMGIPPYLCHTCCGWMTQTHNLFYVVLGVIVWLTHLAKSHIWAAKMASINLLPALLTPKRALLLSLPSFSKRCSFHSTPNQQQVTTFKFIKESSTPHLI